MAHMIGKDGNGEVVNGIALKSVRPECAVSGMEQGGG